jgi:RimJ/RimL family protein N-acetyltransferase
MKTGFMLFFYQKPEEGGTDMELSRTILSDGRRLILRQAAVEDAEDTIAYVRDVIGESDYLLWEPGEFRPSPDKQRELLEHYASSDTHLFLIAEVEGEIAGMLNFQPGGRIRNAHTGEFGMSVRKKYWGLSIGRRMVECLLHWARQTGKIRKINLRVREDNERAIRLYRSAGFQIEGKVSREFCVNGQFFAAYHMGIELD